MFDSHAHVATESFDNDRADVIARARAAGLSGWLEVGTDLPQSRKAIELAEKEPGVGATIGVHPNDILTLEEDKEAWDDIEYLSKNPAVKAIGEVGFDFHRTTEFDFGDQRDWLLRFIDLAYERKLPVVFHVRSSNTIDAHDRLIQLLYSLPKEKRPRGVIHTFSGTTSQAWEYIELGLYISFSGVVTYKNAPEIANAAKMIPLDKILIETDCPYLAPHPYRGKKNEPAYVALVAEKIAQLQGKPMKDVVEQTDANAKQLFNIP